MTYFSKINSLLLALFLLSFSHISYAKITYTINSVPNPYKQSQMVFIVDPDNIITEQDRATINNRLDTLEQQTSIETIVVALNSIGDVDTREFANHLFNYWKIGKSNKDNGLLILLVLDQREVVFETGYGLEGQLPDIACYQIQQKYMVPYLRDNDFSQGMLMGALTIYDYFTDSDMQQNLLEDDYDEGISWKINWLFFFYVTIISLVIVVVIPHLIIWKNPKKLLACTQIIGVIVGFLIFIILPSFFIFIFIYRFYFNWLKDKATECPKCKKYGFKVLKKSVALAYFDRKELFEIKIKSVEYRVCKCNNCQYIFKLHSKNKKYERCSSCKVIASKKLMSKVIKAATYTSVGRACNTYECLYCHKKEKRNVTLPKQTRSSSSSGSSSSSSSSSSSYGGGSSGGGGSRSSF